MILTPMGLTILLWTLRLGLDGKNVLLGSSPLAGRLGERIAVPEFSLVDDPLVDLASGSSARDGEGVPRRIVPLIEEGVVKNFLYDLDTASRAGVETTGHGESREPTNWRVCRGGVPLETLVGELEEGLLVEHVLGLGQGNAMAGEFSVNVAQGYKIEKGEIVGRVKDVMVAGNVYDALMDIDALSAEEEWNPGWFEGSFPYVRVGRLSVIGK
ncbi:MAG: metallopeptidase TldD-related protein [Planctomycetota bacterium]